MEKRAYWNIIIAAALWGCIGVFLKLLTAAGFSSMEGVAVRGTVAAVVYGVFLALTFAGCALVTGLFPLGQQHVSLSTLLFGLGSGLGYALYSIFGKFALRKYPSSTVTFYTFLFSALFALPLSGLFKGLGRLADWRSIAGALGIGVVCCILPYLLYTEGLRRAEAGKAAILATIEPFVAALLGICLFHEAVTPYKLLGMAAIFCAILLLNRPAGEKSPGP